MATVAVFKVEVHEPFTTFILGLLYYLAYFLVVAFIPFELVKLITRGRG